MTLPLSNSIRAQDAKHVVHPHTNLRTQPEAEPLVITRGEGIYVIDDAGNRYLEAAAGLWCASLGFGNARIAEVAAKMLTEIGYYHIFRGAANAPAAELSAKLSAIAPEGFDHVLLQCSGSEANDTAIKLVWYYWDAKGAPQRRKIISREQSYHGTSTITSCLTGKPKFHTGYGLPFDGFLYTAMPYYYRNARPGESEQDYSTRLADELEEMILAEGPETIAAFWAEPLLGSGGAIVPPDGYYEKIQAVLAKYDILFVADEVICGFARTGEMWGSQTYGMRPDMITCAKALSAAMQPISAVLIGERVFEQMKVQSDRFGSFTHGYTYAGHPVAAAVALEVLKIYEEMDLVGHVKALEPGFLAGFEALKDHPLVGDSGGVGLIGAVEIVADKETRAMHPPELKVMQIFEERASRNGLITRIIGNRIALSPPQIITAAEVEEMFARLRRALDETAQAIAG
ncbi:aminotransferase [Salipiger abyssi]|uniref:4-aminobutyrate---pyruvate transaminase n=1 Tax=Salipiger abyssi TaxID=1250539 RepID=A0A1P8US32_9RHOB|nr:aminotransferase [Salipiger abyssi]APZ52210.1 4-aminobutyrate---pyruvate transaminase [Salipiger abyssi]